MERKDYVKKFMEIKSEILQEIRNILGNGAKHTFREGFFVHYIEGESSISEVCSSIETDGSGMVILHVINGSSDVVTVEAENVFNYDPESFLNILDNLKEGIREEKLNIIRTIIKENGGSIDIKDNYKFLCADEGDEDNLSDSYLKGIEIDGERILVKTIWKADGEQYDYHENCITNNELDGIIKCLRKHTRRKYVIRVSGSFSRTFDIEANSYEEALAKAQKEWEETPLYSGDSNGEDWENFT